MGVWLFWPRIKDNSTKLKLAKVFHGPYVIVTFHTDSTVWLKHTITGKYLTKSVTIHRLKKAIDRQTLEDRWSDYDIGYDDPQELNIGDLPMDSFIPEEQNDDDSEDEYNDSQSDSEIENSDSESSDSDGIRDKQG